MTFALVLSAPFPRRQPRLPGVCPVASALASGLLAASPECNHRVTKEARELPESLSLFCGAGPPCPTCGGGPERQAPGIRCLTFGVPLRRSRGLGRATDECPRIALRYPPPLPDWRRDSLAKPPPSRRKPSRFRRSRRRVRKSSTGSSVLDCRLPWQPLERQPLRARGGPGLLSAIFPSPAASKFKHRISGA